MNRKRGRGFLSTIADFGGKILNKSIDLLPFEAHLPGYNFCGPGTKLSERLKKGDTGINKLDEFCKQHDIAYAANADSKRRAEADKILAEQAWSRFKSKDSSLGERGAALLVTNLMKAKSQFGSGLRKRRRKPVKKRTVGRGLYLRRMRGKGLQISRKRISNSCRRKKQNRY
jgi:hypothetical protein